MDPQAPALPPRIAVSVVLILALLQGGALYGLQHVLVAHEWPATQPPWLLALYSAVVFIPTTLQLLAEQLRKRSLWVLLAGLAAVFFYFGWHHGDAVAGSDPQRFASSETFLPFTFVLLVWWLHALPFLQGRVSEGKWTADYRLLFRYSWRNVLLLGEAALFTGLFWLILVLWEGLFRMLGINFFSDLFAQPAFIYPVTALVFGGALHLIGSIDALVTVALEQVLNVLKWLAVVAVALLTLFTVALLIKLPELLFTGERAIGAAWLLWLVAVVVLLLNAAYRDGTVQRPYPLWIAQGLRFCSPLAMVVAFTALYALIIRAHSYGLTVGRVWALLVAGAAVMYSVGYSVAALRKGPWLAGIAQVNVVVALVLIATLAAGLTPLLSPYRLAASSQFRTVLAGQYPPTQRDDPRAASLQYLRFDCGAYGLRSLQRLASLRDHPDAERIRQLASKALAQSSRYQNPQAADAKRLVSDLTLYPQGRKLDPQLAQKLVADWATPAMQGILYSEEKVVGVFVDLDGDGVEEFVLLGHSGGPVYQSRSGQWEYIGRVNPRGVPAASEDAMRADLSSGHISAAVPQWRDLAIGAQRFRIDETP